MNAFAFSLKSPFSPKKNLNLASKQLAGHDDMGKHDALLAVDALQQYKTNVHEFTEDIIEFWPLAQRVMERYHFDNAEELNEWLDNL